jgi:glycosyltransferase involved in cell wall biosynthesis
MRILIFASFYYPHIGGYEKNIHELAKRLVVEGHEVKILTCNTENVSELQVLDGVYIYRMPCWNILNKTFPIPKPFSRLFNVLFSIKKHRDCDMVITQTRFFILSFIGMVYAKLNKFPLIHVERGTCHSVVSNKLVSIVARIYDHTIGSLIVSHSNANIGVSNAASEFIKHLGGLNTVTIYNGIETA